MFFDWHDKSKWSTIISFQDAPHEALQEGWGVGVSG